MIEIHEKADGRYQILSSDFPEINHAFAAFPNDRDALGYLRAVGLAKNAKLL